MSDRLGYWDRKWAQFTGNNYNWDRIQKIAENHEFLLHLKVTLEE